MTNDDKDLKPIFAGMKLVKMEYKDWVLKHSAHKVIDSQVLGFGIQKCEYCNEVYCYQDYSDLNSRATPQQPSEPLEEKKYLDSCDAYEYVKAIVSNYSEDEARRRINSFLHRDVDCEKPQEPLKDSATTKHEKLIEKVKVYEEALWVITTDFHEDNPDRHINPDTEWKIAERALQKTGAMKK